MEEVTAAMDNNNVTDKAGEESAAAVWGAVQYGVPAEPVQESSALIDWDSLNANREENEKRRYNFNYLLPALLESECFKVYFYRWEHVPELVKDFYEEHGDVTSRSEKEVAEFRRSSNNIEVKNFLPEDTSPAMKPVTKFEEAFHQFPGILSTIRKQASRFVFWDFA